MKKLNDVNVYPMLRKILCITLILSLTLGMLQPAMAMERFPHEIEGAASGDLLNIPLENLFPGGNGKAIAISAGHDKLYVLVDSGTVWYFEFDYYESIIGQCHQIEGLSNIVSIDATYNSIISLGYDGRVWEWDREICGLNNIVEISADMCGFMARSQDGQVWCEYHDLDLQQKYLGDVEVVSISMGAGHNMAVVEHPYHGRSVISWCYNSSCLDTFKLYDEITESGLLFTEEDGYAEVLYNDWVSCWIIDSDGQVWWMEDYYPNDYNVLRLFMIDNFIDIAACCNDIYLISALKADGTVYILDNINNTISQVENLEDIVDVTLLMRNAGTSFALGSDGTIYHIGGYGSGIAEITDFSTDDAWYNFSFIDENNKTVEGYISGLGSKSDDYEDIYAVAYREGDVV